MRVTAVCILGTSLYQSGWQRVRMKIGRLVRGYCLPQVKNELTELKRSDRGRGGDRTELSTELLRSWIG